MFSQLPGYESGFTSAYAAQVAADAPVAWWRMGEPSGTTTANSGSQSGLTADLFDGVTLGSPGLISGDSSTAFTFAPSAWIRSPTTGLLLNRNFTLEAWVQITTAATNGILSLAQGGYYLRVHSDGSLHFLKSQFADIGSSAASVVTTGTKHHIVCTVDASGNWTLYVDGVSVASGSTGQTFDASSVGYVLIGCDANTSARADYFNGTIDEVAIYGTALSSTRVSAHYSAGA